MQALSETLIDLYHAAEHASIGSFPLEAVRLVRRLLEFDGCVLGWGETHAAWEQASDLVINRACVHERDPAILQDYAQVSLADPITQCFVQGLEHPLCCSAISYYHERRLDELEAFAKKHDMSQLLLLGDPSSFSEPTQWIVLYRGTQKKFCAMDMQYLAALWLHVSRALRLNRAHHLELQLGERQQRAAAIIDMQGRIEVADARFKALVAMEWPGFCGNAVPTPLLQCAQSGADYIGEHLHVSSTRRQDCIVCYATEAGRLKELTKAERLVASQFAIGLSHKDVARNLGVSHNTVRTHIMHIYDKLDIHDKSGLINALSIKRH